MEKLKIAIVGFGGMGHYHSQLLRKNHMNDLYELVGIYDISSAAVDKAKSKGIGVFDSAEQIALSPDVDAVLIATPNDLHKHYACFFAEAGKHIICEKPIGMNSEEAREMYAAADRNAVKLMVNQNRRWDKDYITIKEIINGGYLKDVYCLESRVMGSNGIPRGWREEVEHGGGMLLDWGVHLIDQIFMLKGMPDSVYCDLLYNAVGADKDLRLVMYYADGFRADIIVDTNCYEPLPRWMVFGQDGTAVIKNWELEGGITCPVGSDADIVGMKAGNGFTKTMAYRKDGNKAVFELPHVEVDGNEHYRNFYDAVKKGAELYIRGEQVVAVFEIMEAAFRSAREHVAVKMLG